MLDQDPELSSDLEWLLQSGQASQEVLLRALAEHYLVPIYHLALAVLEEPASARLATRETFSSVLLNLYRYSGQAGAECWIYGLALDAIRRQAGRLKLSQWLARRRQRSGRTSPKATNETETAVWHAFARLDEEQRIPVFLHYVQGWSDSQIASLIPSKGSMSGAANAQASFLKTLKKAGLELAAEDRDTQLAQALQARWPMPVSPNHDLSAIPAESLEQASRLGASRRTIISFKEILLVGAAILLAVGLIWKSNAALPAPTPTISPKETQPTVTPPANITMASTSIASEATIRPTGVPLVLAIPTRIPTSSPTPQGVFYYVQPGDTLAAIAANMGIPVNELISTNRLIPGTGLIPGSALVNPRGLTPGPNTTATPVTPVARRPLKSSPEPAEISQYLQDIPGMKLWHNAWFDAQLVYYGPPGYMGPQHTYRLQAWLGEEQSLLVGGPPQGPPDQVILMNGYGYFTAQPGLNRLWYTHSDQLALLKPPLFEAYEMLLVADPLRLWNVQNFRYQSIGRELINGKAMAVVEQTDLYGDQNLRLWLDVQGGFIMRQQKFALSNPKWLVEESRITKIAYDIDFPQQLFDPKIPWRGGFAADYTGRPEPVSPTPTGQPTPRYVEQFPLFYRTGEIDASQRSLNFEYPAYYDHFSFDSDFPGPFDTHLFADGYFLGIVELPDPFYMTCARSPDGQRIAFSTRAVFSLQPSTPLHWFALSDIGSVAALPGNFQVSEFAFAPDSRHLAFIADQPNASAGIYLLDTDTGITSTLLDSLNQANYSSLTWSPDGKSLAWLMLSYPDSHIKPQVIVLRIENWQVTDRYQFELGAPDMQASLPFSPDWMGKFPTRMGGLEACAQPPAKNK